MALPDDENPEHSLGDCSICMEPIYVQPDTGDETVGRLKAAANRRTYAVAPCHHLFVSSTQSCLRLHSSLTHLAYPMSGTVDDHQSEIELEIYIPMINDNK
jgi:hypothetical protein